MKNLDCKIDNLAHKRVEYKKLGDILVRTKGTKITASQMQLLHKENSPIRVFAGGKTFANVEYGDIPARDVNEAPSIIVKSRGIIEFEYYDKPFSHKNEFWSYHCPTNEICLKFVYYYLVENTHYFQQIANKMQMPQISIPVTDNFRIPLPPLPVQEEIVRILDTFSSTVAELEAERAARIRQYEHYRDNLLTFNETAGQLLTDKQVRWVTLGEIATKISTGGTPNTQNSSFYDGTIPWLRTQEVNWLDIYDTGIKITDEGFNDSSANWIPMNCVIVAMYGATAAKVAINKISLTTNQACCNIQVDETKALYRYVFYWLCKEYETLRAKGQGSQSNINSLIVKNHPIPLPSLEEQSRIVEILDRFDTLVNDLKTGLPAEIALRRKQYEHYRDTLLTFTQTN